MSEDKIVEADMETLGKAFALAARQREYIQEARAKGIDDSTIYETVSKFQL